MQFDRVKRIFLVSDSDIRRSEENTNEHTNNSSINNKCLQGLILIWIDEHAKNYSLNSLRTKAILKEISDNNCLFINDINDLSTIIQKQKEENKEILIIMGESYAKNHLKNEIITEKIIIFSPNYQDKDDLKKLNSNILNICTNFEELQNILENNCESLSFGLFTNQTMESFRPLTPLKGADNCNSYYDYMLFIEILKDMPQTKESKDIMLNKAKDYYEKIEKNSKYPTKIEKFRNKYISNDAIRWYQKDSFVYRIINRAFRTNNVQIWYLFRYYINDLCKQIENIHKIQNIQQSLKLYRGQIISTNEIKILQLNPNFLSIFFMKFFHITKQPLTSNLILFNISENFKRPSEVKFKVDINSDINSSNPIDSEMFNWMNYKNITLFNETCASYVKLFASGPMTKWKSSFECHEDGPTGYGKHVDNQQLAVIIAIEDYLKKTNQSTLLTYEQIQQLTII
ncbi:hypothetical protein I4U23_010694 [Adineta vaga]|nr:hypothetical protein I4U23_010694 [Adineta vaga]